MRGFTPARIGIGRSGTGRPTAATLDFQLAAARARDAVHRSLDNDVLERALLPLSCLRVRSMAAERDIYLRRPDLGRRLDEDDHAMLAAHAEDEAWDIVFVVADGLSAAATAYAPPLIHECRSRMVDFRIAPVVLAAQGRVALGDAIGAAIGARCVAVMLGERPGLTVSESLGLYLSWSPRIGLRDSQRNCISNIHASGLSIDAAAHRAVWLIRAARRLQMTGVALKEAADDAIAIGEMPTGLPSDS